jgi:GNAT superfamily N-acetyltransferase
VLRDREHTRAIGTIVAAFVADPVERWLWPEPWRYLAHFPEFVAAFAGAARVSTLDDDDSSDAAVAMWLPPGVGPDGERIVGVLERTVPDERLAAALAVLERMDQAHPDQPVWYLPWLAVDPARQHKGLGSRLLAQDLERHVDPDGRPAYLETPNPRTVPLYERFGFTTVAVSQHGECPPITSMLRAPR